MYTQIECPSCHTIVKAEDIIPGERKAVCYRCHNQFDIGRDLDIRIRRKNRIYQPSGVTMYKTPERLELGFSMGLLPKGCSFWSVFGIMAGGLTLVLIILSFLKVGIFEFIFEFEADYFILGTFMVIILAMSFSVALKIKKIQSVTRIDIEATRDELIIIQIKKNEQRNSDQPPKRDKVIVDPRQIEQFYVVEQNESDMYFYALQTRKKTGEELALLPLVKDLQLALFAEQELEDFYDIKDESAQDEVKV